MFTLEVFFGAAETTSTRRQSHSSLGPWGDRGSVYRSVPVPAPQYVHLQIHDRSPKQRFRRRLWLALTCLGAVGIGAAILTPPSATKSDAAIAPRDPVSRAETIPTASPVEYAAVDAKPGSEQDARVIAQKPFCLGPSPSDGSCVVFQLPKVRMVRVMRPHWVVQVEC